MHRKNIKVEYVVLACGNSQISIGDKTRAHITLKGRDRVWLHV